MSSCSTWLMAPKDEFTARMFEAINGMLLDVFAAVARKNYEDRRRRRFEGQAKARPQGSTKAAKRMSSAMQASPACWPPNSLGARSKPLEVPAAQTIAKIAKRAQKAA